MKKPNIFQQWPSGAICPVCKTSEQGECVLVPIDGTREGGIQRAIPVHRDCAVATNFNEQMGILYTSTK